MTILEKNLIKKVGSSRSKKEAMIKAGYRESTASKQQARTFRKPDIQKAIKQLDAKAIKRYDEAFDADKVIALPDEPNVVMPDHQIRLKAVDMHFKARGVYQEGTTNNVQVNNYIDVAQKQREKYGE